jgi:hypothetical protein
MIRSLVDARPASGGDVEAAEACCGQAPTAAALRPEEAGRHAAVLKALADPHQLRVLSLFAGQPSGDPLRVREIEGEVRLSNRPSPTTCACSGRRGR